ncbi:putative epimerase/dehydratase [Chytriomyces sp. MP71]|nr:putative epimerase/dehydratase [Chytriomyces sp. MP71]
MKVFVTGASGFVGSAVVQELLQAGHTVTGLARSDASAAAILAAGAQVHRGDLTDHDAVIKGALAADATLHLGFNHDFSRYVASCAEEDALVRALGIALANTGKVLVVTSGTAVVIANPVATETSAVISHHPRALSETAAAEAARAGTRTLVVRLPPSVHGKGDKGFVPMLVGIAKAKGMSAFVGEGANEWPSVHRVDAAVLYRLAMEDAFKVSSAEKQVTIVHAVADTGVAFKGIASIIGKRLGVPVKSITADEAENVFGFLHIFISMQNATSAEVTRQRYGWTPTQPGLLADLDSDAYFSS